MKKVGDAKIREQHFPLRIQSVHVLEYHGNMKEYPDIPNKHAILGSDFEI
jgi:hypothetical protein